MPPDPRKRAQSAQVQLEDLQNTSASDIKSAIKRLERRIIMLAGQMPTKDDGRLTKTALALKQAERLHAKLLLEFERLYGPAVTAHGDNLDAALQVARESLSDFNVPESFSKVDLRLLDQIKGQSLASLEELGRQTQERIAQGLYEAIAAAAPIDELAEEIAHAMTGLVDKRGRPMSQYADLFAHDQLMEAYSTGHRLTADQIGLEHYLYYGDVIRDSREFCVARAGNVYEKQEIESWQALDWAGKKPGSIWIVRGGYRCRHHFQAVDPEWIEGGSIEVQRFQEDTI